MTSRLLLRRGYTAFSTSVADLTKRLDDVSPWKQFLKWQAFNVLILSATYFVWDIKGIKSLERLATLYQLRLEDVERWRSAQSESGMCRCSCGQCQFASVDGKLRLVIRHPSESFRSPAIWRPLP